MWKQFNQDGFLQYPNFLEVVQSIIPMYILRAIGGTLYLTGVVLMAVNLYQTAKSGQFVPEQEAQAAPLDAGRARREIIRGAIAGSRPSR